MNKDIIKIHEGDRLATFQGIADQAKITNKLAQIVMKCPCGIEASLTFFYRCAYCDIYFCKNCITEHFGAWKK